MTEYRTPILLVLAAFLLGGASYYVTDVRQENRIETLSNSRRAAELMVARVEDLLAQESVSVEAADAALSRWHSRYKYIPREMNTADIVEYLEGLTRTGFEAFDLKLAGRVPGQDFSTYRFEVKGQGLYAALYHLVWHLENNREFYRISDLRMEHVDFEPEGGGRRRDLVSFSFGLDAYFGGLEGISAPEADLAPIPVGLLLPHTTDNDIFRPIVRVPRDAPSVAVTGPEIGAAPAPAAAAPASAPTAETPRAAEARAPQTPAVERASLLLIVGSQAVFDDGTGEEITARIGDDLFGGTLTNLDPTAGTARIRVEDGGRVRLVQYRLGEGPPRR